MTDKRVNIIFQVVISFIPYVSLYASYRIKKFRKILVINLIVFGALLLPLIIVYNIVPDIPRPLMNKPGWVYELMIYLFGTYAFAHLIIPIVFLIKWSMEWNKKIQSQMESTSKEEA